jgi:hypothetical protein
MDAADKPLVDHAANLAVFAAEAQARAGEMIDPSGSFAQSALPINTRYR